MTREATRGRIALAMALAVALAACGSGQADGPDTTEPMETTTTAAPEPTSTTPRPAPTTSTPTTTSTTGPATTTTARSSVYDQAGGSGCTPGPGKLPDGEWFGFVVDADDEEIEFDLACWFSGDAAARAAAEDGEESPPPNDYYIRNRNDLKRMLEVAGAAEVVWYPQLGDPSSETTTTYQRWVLGVEERDVDRDLLPMVWVEVKDGVVVKVQEQWVP